MNMNMNMKSATKSNLLIILILLLSLVFLTKECKALPLFNMLFNNDCNDNKYIYTDGIVVNQFIHSYLNNSLSNSLNTTSNNDPEEEVEPLNTKYKYKYKYLKNKYTRKSNESNESNKSTHNITNSNIIPNTLFDGDIIIVYKTLSHCVFKCKMNVINSQYTKEIVHKYLDNNYKIDKSILNIKCNSKGGMIDKTLCSLIKKKDEL